VLVMVMLSVERDPVDHRVQDMGRYVIEPPFRRRRSAPRTIVETMRPQIGDFHRVLDEIVDENCMHFTGL
jgi:hypothetical protein